MKASSLEKLECVEREIKQRERVYPRLCERGTMTLAKASREIEVMRQIAEDYHQKVEEERLI